MSLVDGIDNYNVMNALLKARQVISRYKVIAVSISGGSDSDIMLDIIEKVKTDYNDVRYAFFDTGIEFQATKEHLDYLEDRYGVKIDRVKAKTPIPTAIKRKGVPFLSKNVSMCVNRCQLRKFDWTDDTSTLSNTLAQWWESRHKISQSE